MTGVDAGSPVAWLLIDPDLVPDVPGPRRTFAVVPLSAADAEAVLSSRRGAGPADAELLRLVAAGYTQPRIARKLDVSVRTVERRLERLRQQAGVASTTELAAHLARTGH